MLKIKIIQNKLIKHRERSWRKDSGVYLKIKCFKIKFTNSWVLNK